MELNAQINKEVLSKLDNYLSLLKFKWDSLYPKKGSFFSKARILDCTIFLISVLDNLILFVQDNIPKGPDKKLAVMTVISGVFDHIMSSSSPIWLKPFVPTIKEIVVNIIISQLIEFIVNKYKKGSWKEEAPSINPPDMPQKSIVYISKREDNNG